ncbi:MAG: hypothetical protein IJT49_06475 [Clostridia bacterium]|nr:hypothetical protein [Clostridia bacterium]
MDIKLLDGKVRGSSLGAEALISIASRQKRREFFCKSLIRCALLTLLFIAFGCFFAIYAMEKGNTYVFFENVPSPFYLRGMLKELFLLSVIPSLCFALCGCFNGRLSRCCDTVFPALYGTVIGFICYTELSGTLLSFSVSAMVKLFPYICHVLIIMSVYTLFCPVCASYGECRRKKSAVYDDLHSCFTYFLMSLTAIILSLILRDLAVLFFKTFG